MDNITHTLTGLALSQAGLNRKTRFATLALIVGSNLPDVDVLWSNGGGGANYLDYHRGITHSLLGVAVLGAALAGLLYFLGRRFPTAKSKGTKAPKVNAPPVDVRWLFGVCWIATGGHLLMDFTNQYGVRPFLPFSDRWYALDIMPIVDLLLLPALILGLGIPALFRVISEEVGAGKPAYQRGAIFALAFLVLLWGLRDLAHRRVLGLLDGHTYEDENPANLGAFPTFVNPFAWTGVVETSSGFHLLSVNALANDVDPRHSRDFPKPEPSPPLEAALKSRTGAIFAHFARFLWVQVEETDDGNEVTLRDLRFASPAEDRLGFAARITLDHNLRVVSEWFSFTGQRRN
ncbi:MAG: metal-dependent hydrolase [Terriglobia bacterium]